MARRQTRTAVTVHPSVVALGVDLFKLNGRDYEFASDLVRKAERYGASEKQLFWIEKLLARARGEEPQPAREIVSLGNFAGIMGVFDKAAEKLKAPVVALHVDGIGEVRLSRAGSSAKHPGSINVATPGGYGNNTWFGRILKDGSFEKSPRADATTALVSTLMAFAAAPAQVAAEHGKLMGKCCFCRIPLKDERSTAVGYGPVCAANFGLPWGH